MGLGWGIFNHEWARIGTNGEGMNGVGRYLGDWMLWG